MGFYQYHVFFCVNQRAGGEACCNDHHAKDMQVYAKQRIKELGLKSLVSALERAMLAVALALSYRIDFARSRPAAD